MELTAATPQRRRGKDCFVIITLILFVFLSLCDTVAHPLLNVPSFYLAAFLLLRRGFLFIPLQKLVNRSHGDWVIRGPRFLVDRHRALAAFRRLYQFSIKRLYQLPPPYRREVFLKPRISRLVAITYRHQQPLVRYLGIARTV